MKKIIKYIPVLLLSLLFTSCLKSGLDGLPAYSDAEITNFRFEYRWMDTTSEFHQLQVVQMNVAKTIDADNHTISCQITVPAASAGFPEEIRNQVSLSNLVGYADISLAATIKPMGDSPTLGDLADFSKGNLQYEVTAADGTKKVWTLNITGFNK